MSRAEPSRTEQFFRRVTARPKTMLALALLMIAVLGAGLNRLHKDTSVRAFMPSDHPAVLENDRVREIFGVADPIVLSVQAESGTVFSPEYFAVVRQLTEQIAELENIRADRVASVATESAIDGRGGALIVQRYADDPDEARKLWQEMPPHVGTLVSEDHSASLVIAEFHDQALADQTYLEVVDLAEPYKGEGLRIDVAGPGAVSGFLSLYIDRDARKLQPLVFILIVSFIFLAFRRWCALPGPLMVVIGATAGALGLMSWLGVSYFAITSALPVVIVAIAVADSIHILSAFYQQKARHSNTASRELVISAMTDVARPITLTTITTIAGFTGIASMSVMPPVMWFAIFAMVGVGLAWLFSFVALPNLIVLINPSASPAFESWAQGCPPAIGRYLTAYARSAARQWRWVAVGALAALGLGILGASQLEIDRNQVENFAPDEPLRIADAHINETFAGTASLDVLVESDAPEGILDAAHMAKIAALQSKFESLPHVTKTVSIVDYLHLLHSAIEETDPTPLRTLPASDEAIAQYLLLYEISGDPTDLAEEIDPGYQSVLIRGLLDSSAYQQTRGTVEAMSDYLRSEFNEPGLTATLAGNVHVGYHWMTSLSAAHFKGVLLSLILVTVTSACVFRSITAGILAVTPVALTVLMLYAAMGFFGVHLEPATSMFAAIALGVGVDFAIHLVDRVMRQPVFPAEGPQEVLAKALPVTVRACLFNSAALGFGFSVLLLSELPTLQRFGGLIALSVGCSYIAALTLLPVGLAMLRGRTPRFSRRASVATLLFIALASWMLVFAKDANAEDAPRTAENIARNIDERGEAEFAFREINLTLTPERGKPRHRTMHVYKRSDELARRTRIVYTAPRILSGTAFLSVDPRNTQERDQRWMYTPATERVRRLPTAERGKAFFGTDLSYEDVESELKFDLSDYDFGYEGALPGQLGKHVLIGTPRSPEIAKELRYGGFRAHIDEESWLPLKVDFADVHGEPLKTVYIREHRQVDGIWTATHIEAVNHQTGHRTDLVFSQIVHPETLDEELFEAHNLPRIPATPGAAQ